MVFPEGKSSVCIRNQTVSVKAHHRWERLTEEILYKGWKGSRISAIKLRVALVVEKAGAKVQGRKWRGEVKVRLSCFGNNKKRWKSREKCGVKKAEVKVQLYAGGYNHLERNSGECLASGQ